MSGYFSAFVIDIVVSANTYAFLNKTFNSLHSTLCNGYFILLVFNEEELFFNICDCCNCFNEFK